MYKQILFLILIAALSGNVSAQKKLVLVNNATSNYKIVIPADANEIEKQAAAVLQDYIQKITNFKIPVTIKISSTSAYQIIVGRNKIIPQRDLNNLGGDGFIIRSVNNTLILTGGTRKGVLYSVYTLLEDYLGCRMYTAAVTEVPHQSSISLPASIARKEIPSFAYRTTFYVESLNHTYSDFHKMNYFFEDWGLFAHTFENLVPQAKYFASHPEYYALVGGKRNPSQLCLTNAAVLNVVIQNLAQMIKEKPGAKYWSVSQNDNDNFCECDNCKRLNNEQGSYQGSILTFVNNVAKHFPNKTISTLAYRKTETPPKTIRPLPNVLIMLCTSYNDRRVPLKDQTSLSFYNNFKNWAAITSHLFIWDYIAQFANSISPFPNIYTIQPNVQYFASKNVTHLFLQGIGEMPAEFSELRCYMVSRVMWNKNADIKATMSEFIDGYYGKTGARYISEYIALLDKNASLKPVEVASGGSPVNAVNGYLSPANIKAYKSIFLAAVKATEGTVYNARIMKEYLPVLYAELEINKTMIAAGKINIVDKDINKTLLEDFYRRMKQLNITSLNEAWLNVDDYYKSYSDLIGK